MSTKLDGPILQPKDLRQRARMYQWISAVSSYYYPYMSYHLSHERLIYPALRIAPDEKVVAHALPRITVALDVMERELRTDTAYLLGDQLTLADFFILPTMTSLSMTSEGQEMLKPGRGSEHGAPEWKHRPPSRRFGQRSPHTLASPSSMRANGLRRIGPAIEFHRVTGPPRQSGLPCPNARIRELPKSNLKAAWDGSFLLRLQSSQINNPAGKKQCPLETSVQRLRNTRNFEEICAWNGAKIQFPQKLCMQGSAPKRRRS
jgi:hypothetical protein